MLRKTGGVAGAWAESTEASAAGSSPCARMDCARADTLEAMKRIIRGFSIKGMKARNPQACTPRYPPPWRANVSELQAFRQRMVRACEACNELRSRWVECLHRNPTTGPRTRLRSFELHQSEDPRT